MVARNFSLQDLPYSLHQVPDDEREFMTLDELKPHQLTELGVAPQQHQQHKLAHTISDTQHQQPHQKSQSLNTPSENLQNQLFSQHGYYDSSSGQATAK
jgi:hypothetical protein